MSTINPASPIFVDRIVSRNITSDALLILFGIGLTAASAQLQIPALPVPFTFQTLAVLLIGATYGKFRASITMAAYVLLGALGLPIFAGGAAGVEKIFGATGGFLIGFIIAAYLTGYLAELNWSSKSLKMFTSFVLGSVVIYLVGIPVLALTAFASDLSAATLFMLPYMLWDVVKALLAAAIVPGAFALVRKIKN